MKVALELEERDIERIYSIVRHIPELVDITAAIETQHQRLTTPFLCDDITSIFYDKGWEDGHQDAKDNTWIDDDDDGDYDDGYDDGYDNGYTAARKKYSKESHPQPTQGDRNDRAKYPDQAPSHPQK